jgi:hypothetical protein
LSFFPYIFEIYFYRYQHENGFTITSLAWNPNGKPEIAFCDREVLLSLLNAACSMDKKPTPILYSLV